MMFKYTFKRISFSCVKPFSAHVSRFYIKATTIDFDNNKSKILALSCQNAINSPSLTLSNLCGADLIAYTLYLHGVRNVYGLPGGVICSILTSLTKYNINFIGVRSEPSAVFAADISYWYNNIPGIAILTSAAGVYAFHAQTPLITIGGQVPKFSQNMGGMQDSNQIETMQTVCKYCCTIDKMSAIVDTLNNAFHIAVSNDTYGAPGPVFVEIPSDLSFPLADTLFFNGIINKYKNRNNININGSINNTGDHDKSISDEFDENDKDLIPQNIINKLYLNDKFNINNRLNEGDYHYYWNNKDKIKDNYQSKYKNLENCINNTFADEYDNDYHYESIKHIVSDSINQTKISNGVSNEPVSKDDIRLIYNLLKNSKKPLIFINHAAFHNQLNIQEENNSGDGDDSSCYQSIADCIEYLNVPYYGRGMAKGILPSNHSLSIRNGGAKHVYQDDFVLCLGVAGMIMCLSVCRFVLRSLANKSTDLVCECFHAGNNPFEIIELF